jgi:hypothetical protein
MVGDKEAVGRTHRIVDKLVVSKENERGGLHHLIRWLHLPASSPRPSFVATPASFSFGASRGEAEAECLGDDVASPGLSGNMIYYMYVITSQL